MGSSVSERSEQPQVEVVRLEGAKLKVLAHPLRSRLLAELRTAGAATATILAERLNTNSGATSYHLRRLADVGLVEEAGEDSIERTSGRQRWWQAAHRHTSWVESDFDSDPDERANADWLLGHYFRSTNGWLEEWHAARREWPIAWRNAADHSDYQLDVDPAELEALNAELHEVIGRHVEASRVREVGQQHDGRRRVAVVVHVFPRADKGP